MVENEDVVVDAAAEIELRGTAVDIYLAFIELTRLELPAPRTENGRKTTLSGSAELGSNENVEGACVGPCNCACVKAPWSMSFRYCYICINWGADGENWPIEFH